MTNNSSINQILDELDMNDNEQRIFNASIREVKAAQINDEVDAKAAIFEMIREEFK